PSVDHARSPWPPRCDASAVRASTYDAFRGAMGTCGHAGWSAGEPALRGPSRSQQPAAYAAPPRLDVRPAGSTGPVRPGELVVRLRGEVDLVTWHVLADGLDAAVEAAEATPDTAAVVLDTSELSFCDVRGMEMLLTTG